MAQVHEKKLKKHNLLTVYFWVLSFMSPYKWQLLLLIICGIVLSGVELIIPKFIQYFTDTILPQNDIQQFWLLISVIIVSVIVMIGFTIVLNLLERIVQEKSSRDLQYAIYAHLRKLGFAYFEKHPIGESLALMNSEVASLQDFYRRLFPWMVNGLIFSSLAIIIMAQISMKLSLIILASFLLYYIFGSSIQKKASTYGKKLSDERVAFNQKVYESVSSLNDIRVSGAEKWDLKHFVKSLRSFNKLMVKTYFFAYLRSTNRRLSYNIGGIGIIIYGVHLVRTGDITTGAFIAFLLYFFQTMHILTSVITSLADQKVVMYQAEKLYTFLQQPVNVKEAKEPRELSQPEGRISIQNMTFSYPDGPNVLQHFNLDISAGEKVALVGESGCGKTTVLKLLGRFYDPSEGKIVIDGISIDQLSFESLRNNLGFVFQETYLFGRTVKENILFGNPEATEKEVVEAAKAANAHTFIVDLPNGYETLVGERGVKLSGGQKQRISIARLFLKNPPILILDEATSALDNVSEREVQTALDQLMKGRTTITIAHRLSTIMDYDKIVLLENGKIMESGSYEQLLAKKERFFDLAARNESVGVEI